MAAMKKSPPSAVRALTDEAGLTTPETAQPQESTQPQETVQPQRAPLEDEQRRRIEEAAYYKASARGFSPGRELNDWLEAEAEAKKGRR